MTETAFTPSPTVTTRKAPVFASYMAGLVCGGLIFWAGHQYWPSNGPALPGMASSGQTSASVASTVPLGPSTALTRNTIANIAAEASRSVVNINTSTEVALGDTPFGGALNGFQFFFGDGQPGSPFGDDPSPSPHKMRQMGTGSGVIIRPDGYILTNNHVVRKADSVTVTLADKRTFKAQVVGRDSFTDLALLKIDANNLPVAKLGESKDIHPGDFAVAIGSPVGLDQTVTMGIVSALGRSLDGVGNGVSLVQTDAAINPGNSGGPLLNIDGQVIGINTAIRGDAQNIGFAIPVDVARTVADQLLEHKTAAHPYIGIYMKDIDDELSRSLGLPPNSKGIVVARVAPGSPAAQAGLQVGDVIQKVDGSPVNSAKELQSQVRTHKTGDELHFLVARGNSLDGVAIKIGDFPTAADEDKR